MESSRALHFLIFTLVYVTTSYPTALLGADTFDVLREVADEAVLHEIFDPVLAQAKQAGEELYNKSK